MKIHNYRTPNSSNDKPWKNCLFNAKSPIVTSNDGNPTPLADGFNSQTILRDIISEVIDPGEAISPDQLTAKLTARRQHLNRIERSRNLIAQAAHLGIIHKASADSNDYVLTPPLNVRQSKE